MASTYISLPASSVDGNISVNLNAVTDSVAIGDGVHTLDINPDGSLNVNVGGNSINTYGEISSVASSSLFTVIHTYTAPGDAKLKFVSVSGNNIAEYRVMIDGTPQGKRYTYWSNFNADFDFRDGINLQTGDSVTVEVRHSRAELGNFSANLIINI